ncbi:MAG: 5-bromo-4-chloroindolyl phosphate hydrolysis family protein [Beijerinckiaceae bacterium]|nr:5-bromo-4-chloroindolyl phosphate hydrolysis family protein [Beijerinckiaceae bacterium]
MSWFRGMTALALAAALAPFIFFGLLMLTALGLVALNTFPLILAFVAWMILSRRARKERDELAKRAPPPPPIDGPLPFPSESYTPPVHFDLLLEAKEEIGRIRGAAGAISDGVIATQFRSLAEQADAILAEVVGQPERLGLARRFFSSLLPRAADLAEGYHRADRTMANEARRTKMLDVLYRLDAAMKEARETISSPEIARLDADLSILSKDLKDLNPAFTHAPQPILARVEQVVKSAKAKKG